MVKIDVAKLSVGVVDLWMNPAGFIDSKIKDNYPSADYHRIYFGEIVAAFKKK